MLMVLNVYDYSLRIQPVSLITASKAVVDSSAEWLPLPFNQYSLFAFFYSTQSMLKIISTR